MDMQDGTLLTFGLQLRPRSSMASIVRRFVEETFEKIVGDADAAFRVSLAVHELLENAAKYSIGGTTDLVVRFEADGTGAHIRLTNQTTPERLARLRAFVTEIQSSDAPLVLYSSMMRRALGVEGESGLGLVRIRAEAGLDLSLEIDGNRVTVVASCPSTKRSSV